MAISAVASNAALASTKASKGLADNFDTFLVLLTTQLKNQDPLSPMDSTEFTNQLVQFSSVEQEIQANKNLESLIALISANSSNSALGYLGREVSVESNQTNLKGGAAQWTYETAPTSTASSLVIKNEAGRTILSKAGEFGEGPHSFTWDGKDSNGILQPDGVYTISLNAFDKDAKTVASKVFTSGIVEGVESLNGSPVLVIGGVKASVDKVISVTVPVAKTTVTTDSNEPPVTDPTSGTN